MLSELKLYTHKTLAIKFCAYIIQSWDAATQTANQETEMTKITKQYANVRNGGQERVIREADKFYVNSDFGHGFCQPNRQVSRQEMSACLRFTMAPADVVDAILAN